MDEKRPKKPFEKPDNGVTISGESSYHRVLPSTANEDAVTEPLEVLSKDKLPNEEYREDDQRKYGPFRRHWREPFLRLIAPHGGLRWYIPFVYGGPLILIVSSAFLYITTGHPFRWEWVILGLFLPSYPIGREIYRWRRRMVYLEWAGERIKITCYEPTSIFWGFTGSGNGDSWTFEGSTAFHLRITFANRLIFWGCGDLIVTGKVEGRSPSLDNIPHVRRVRAFLSRPI